MVALMPYLSMASMQALTYFVESSMVWATTARALLRYFVLPMNFTGPELAAPAAATTRTEAAPAKNTVRIEVSGGDPIKQRSQVLICRSQPLVQDLGSDFAAATVLSV